MSAGLAKSLGWFFLEHGFKTLAGLVAALMTISYLDPSDYGVLSLALTIFAVMSAFSALGLDSVLLKKLIATSRAELVVSSVAMRLLAAMIITLLTIMLGLLLDKTWIVLLQLLLITLYFESFTAFRELAFSRKSYRLVVLSNVSASFGQLLLVFLLVYFKAPVYAFVLPLIVNRATFVLVLLGSQRRILPQPVCGFSSVDMPLLKEGLPLMIASVAGLAYAAQDQWMISFFMTSNDVGVYAAALKLVLILVVLPTIITNVLYHRIIALHGTLSYEPYIQALYTAMFYIGLGLFVLVFLSAGFLVTIVFPESYSPAAGVLSIYSGVLLLAFFQSLNNKVLILNGLQRYIMRRVLASLVLNFALNLYLIPRYGLEGAAAATVLSEALIVLSYVLNRQTRDIFWYQLRSINPVNLFAVRAEAQRG